MFGAGAIYMEAFLTLHPDAKLDGAKYSGASVQAEGNVDPDVFRFSIPDANGAGTASYANIAALGAAYEVIVPDAVRSGDSWKGPVSGVQKSDYEDNFPVIVKSAGGGIRVPVNAINATGANASAVEYRAESLSVHGNPIDSVGDVILEAGDGEFVYIYLKELPGNKGSDGYVVLPAESLRVQVNYAASESAEEPSLTYRQWLEREAEKSAVLYKILYEGWDPYSGTMSLDEFHDLMDLFERGIMPLKEISTMALVEPFVEPMVIPAEYFEAIYTEKSESIDLPGEWPGFKSGDVYSNGHVKMVRDNTSSDGFPYIDNDYYVRRVTAEGIEASIIGITQNGSGGFNLYYLSHDDQDTTVSTTTMKDGSKFQLQYSAPEFKITYQLRMYDVNGTEQTLSDDEKNQWLDTILGANRPTQTTDRAYVIEADGPYYYTTAIYDTADGEFSNDNVLTDPKHPLGAEPTFESSTSEGVMADGGYSVLVKFGAYSKAADSDRIIVVVMRRKPDPKFSAKKWLDTKNANTRGTSAKESYEFLKKDGTPNVMSGGDIQEPESNSWNWGTYQSAPSKDMTYDSNTDTWSHRWTFQTNTGDYKMDSLAANGVELSVPFSPAFSANANETAVGMGDSRSCTVTTLPDGATVTVEYLYRMNKTQRIYRVTVTGARSNVTITGGNLMMFGGGAPEFIPSVLVGVTGEVIDWFYGGSWRTDAPKSLPAVTNGNNKFGAENTNNADPLYGADIRFRLQEGYAHPYYTWMTQNGDVIQDSAGRDQTSVVSWDNEGNATEVNPVKALPEAGSGETLDPRYIYGPDEDGYYYIRINSQGGEKVALLSIYSSPVKYVVQYLQGEGPTSVSSMPAYDHSSSHPTLLGKAQIDDNGGNWYDTTTYTNFALSNDRPCDGNATVQSAWEFKGWAVLDANGNMATQPVTDEEGNPVYEQELDENGSPKLDADGNPVYVQDTNDDGTPKTDAEGKPVYKQAVEPVVYQPNTLQSLWDFLKYAVRDDELGGVAAVVDVIRVQAVWSQIANPFKYHVVLNWIDVDGNWTEETFDDWDPVWTTGPGGENLLTVRVNDGAEKLQNWLAKHPTYSFWDELNNAHVDGEIGSPEREQALRALITEIVNKVYPDHDLSIDAFMENGFVRYGNYSFGVLHGNEIVIWMCENKGGLVFDEMVLKEAFAPNEEFYFTVSEIAVGTNRTDYLNGTYYAYPSSITSNDSTSKDAYTVVYKDGKIDSITKEGQNIGNYFTLKSGEGIRLYVPSGTYTVTELGSRSGGAYRSYVEYVGKNTQGDQWNLPSEADDIWLKGSDTVERTPEEEEQRGVSQISATVDFEAGENNVVQVLTFYNQTSSLAIEKESPNANLQDMDFTFDVWLALPGTDEPLVENGQYYYNVNVYAGDNTSVQRINLDKDTPVPAGRLEGKTNIWHGKLSLRVGQRAVIVMQVLDGGFNYYVQEQEDPGLFTLYEKENEEGSIGTGDQRVAVFVNTSFDAGLSVAKTVVGPNAENNDAKFTFTIELHDENGSPVNGNYRVTVHPSEEQKTISFSNGVGTVELQHGQSTTIENLKKGYSYAVTENPAAGYRTLAPNNAAGTFQSNDERIIVGYENAESVSLTFGNDVQGSAEKQYTEDAFAYTVTFTAGDYGLPETLTYTTSDGSSITLTKTGENTYTFSLKDGETIRFDNLPYGTGYTVEQTTKDGSFVTYVSTAYASGGHANSKAYSTNGTLEEEQTVTFLNTIDYAALSVTKIVEPEDGEEIDSDAAFDIKVTLTLPDGKTLTKEDCTFTLDPDEGEEPTCVWSSEGNTVIVTFQLKHGQTFTIGNLLAKTKYKVAEDPVPEGYAASYTNGTGTLESGVAAAAVVTNGPKSDKEDYTLTISKTVNGNLGNRKYSFEFTLDLSANQESPESVTYELDGEEKTLTLTNGKGKFTLMHGESVVFTLPSGTKYTITEANGAYDVTITSDSATDTVNGSAVSGELSANTKISVVNTREGVVPTGVVMEHGWLAALMLLGIAGLIGILCKRRKER